MIITSLRWHVYHIPFTSPFATAHGPLTMRSGALVEITTTTSMGMGEIAPLPAIGGESLDQALAPLTTLAARLQDHTLHEALALLLDVPLPPSTRCGVEIALLDALGKSLGQPLSTLLAAPGVVPRSSIRVNAVIGARSHIEAIRAALDYQAAGYRDLKLKVGLCETLDEEIERVRSVRAAIDPTVQLRLDANEAWTFEQARTILNALADLPIAYIEQPLAASDLAGMQALRAAISMPIAADEAIYDLASAHAVLRHAAADLLILKPQLAGGLYASQRIIAEADHYGVACVLTTTLETTITLAATLHLAAAMPTITLPCGLATAHLLRHDDSPCDPLPITNGTLTVPTRPGLGLAYRTG